MDQTEPLTFKKRVFKGDYSYRIISPMGVLDEQEISVDEDTVINWP